MVIKHTHIVQRGIPHHKHMSYGIILIQTITKKDGNPVMFLQFYFQIVFKRNQYKHLFYGIPFNYSNIINTNLEGSIGDHYQMPNFLKKVQIVFSHL